MGPPLPAPGHLQEGDRRARGGLQSLQRHVRGGDARLQRHGARRSHRAAAKQAGSVT